MQRQILRSGAVLALALAVPAAANAGRLGAEQKEANEFFKGRSFIAKIDLETTGKYFVDPEGIPIAQKKQGRRGNLGIGQRDLVFTEGDGGHGIYIRADESDREVLVALAKKRGLTMHAVKLYIQYPREITGADLDPYAIARALAPYVEFQGLEVGSELADAIDKLEAGGSTGTDSPGQAPGASMLSGLEVQAVPAVVRPGETVVLELLFELAETPGAAEVSVSEQRTLTFEGSMLPGYPVQSDQVRSPGVHTSRYRQPIPAEASLGTYELKGEICAGGHCMSQVIEFEVRE
ncbi:MAG: hypothetical protein K8J08_12150 [Thermoanaerobaculia bacterium]|nr:hypothetical protein [Thermoanaerobaculia bacterium]